jgi:replication factor A1
LKSDDVD